MSSPDALIKKSDAANLPIKRRIDSAENRNQSLEYPSAHGCAHDIVNNILYFLLFCGRDEDQIDVGTRHNTVINSDDQININTSSYFPQYVESSSTRRFILWFSACTRYNISTTIKKHHLPTGAYIIVLQ